MDYTIVISDDEEEVDTSIEVLGVYKPTNDRKEDLLFGPASARSPPSHVSVSSSSTPVPDSNRPVLDGTGSTQSSLLFPQSPLSHVSLSSSSTLVPDSSQINGLTPSQSSSLFPLSSPIIGRSPSPAFRSQPPPIILNSQSTPPLIPDSPRSDCYPTPRRKSRKVSSSNVARAANRAAREEEKQKRAREKEEERVFKEANKANTASRATQNCTAVVDRNILKMINDEEEANFITLFQDSSLNYKITDYPLLEHCVSWTFKRTEVENGECVVKTRDVDMIQVVMEGKEYVRRMALYRDEPKNPQSLNNYICDIGKRFQSKLVILVYNLSNYLKTEIAKEAKNYQRKFKEKFGDGRGKSSEDTNIISSLGVNDLQHLRLTLLIDLHEMKQDLEVLIEFREKTQEVVESVVKYTKSVAGREIKKKERAATNLDWAVNMDKGKAVDPTRSEEDLSTLWIAQLQQFSRATLPIAKTIAKEYPTPSALIDQYESLTTSEAQDLLAELYVQRKKTVGQNISRRIYRFLTCEEPDVFLGTD